MWTETDRLRVPALRAMLADVLAQDVNVRYWRAGADYAAYAVELGDDRLILRAPHREIADTSYDGRVDFADVVRREATIQSLLADGGVPCPRLIAWGTPQEGHPCSWTLSQYIPHEPADHRDDRVETQLGHITRTIHAITPGNAQLQRPESWEDFFANRAVRRIDALGERAPLPAHGDLTTVIQDAVRVRTHHANKLLHMDLRADNLCVCDGEIVAVLDYSNALLGDPWLELGRLHVYDTLTETFINGYGSEARDALDTRALAAYALDTYAMLALLAIDELNDQDLKERMLSGVQRAMADLAS